MAPDISENSNAPKWRDSLAAAVAVGAFLAFLALVLLMFLQRDASETAWSRLVYLLTGVEAVAFAGAGWVFGKEVHRAEAQSAEKQVEAEQQRASQAENEARQATKDANAERIRGVRMAQAVETAHAQQPTGRAGEREISASTKRENALDSVVVLARQLYPELYSDR